MPQRLRVPDQFRQQGWQGHLQRVERWHQRANHALDTYNGVAADDAIDFLYAFFQASYHMRDWLQNSGAASWLNSGGRRRCLPAMLRDGPVQSIAVI
jgi:hypothetical protein